MKYFLDTEFIEDGKTIELISIGIVAENEKELYLECSDTDLTKASPWVVEHVLPNLSNGPFYSKLEIKDKLMKFFNGDHNIELWGYFADYDWVVFCQLFGRMIDIPRIFPNFCMDLKQLAKSKNIKIKQEDSIHNALEDAKWIKQMYFKINQI